jgi:hypothetical protein
MGRSALQVEPGAVAVSDSSVCVGTSMAMVILGT